METSESKAAASNGARINLKEEKFHLTVTPRGIRAPEASTGRTGPLNPREKFSVSIAQLVLRARSTHLWNSVSILCEEEPTGVLVVRVLVFNPDWENGLQIAELRSWPSDPASLTPLGCNLDHIAP